jgi:DNA helicase-2/ATP-dependent DNA helicase PcrA
METDEILKDLNEQQRETVQFKDGQLIIFTGAGTGKTKVITHRMAYLISQGVEPPTILAVHSQKKLHVKCKSKRG